MNNLLCIVGPTATGKTKLALYLAQLFPSILVSADSRQVYRGLDIVTGKDHPPGMIIYGIDLVNPSEPCSVSLWYEAVMSTIEKAWGEGKLPIVVGGTGLYIKALTSGIATMQVGINSSLRDKLEALSITELQAKLRELDHAKFDSMNHSDSLNPRRLIRAIEVAMSPDLPESKILNLDSKLIGLKYFDTSKYRSAIELRVKKRILSGAIPETKRLMTSASPQSLSAIGYRSICAYLNKIISYDQMIEQWVHDELTYAKRQLTWFNKQKVTWYDTDKEDYDYPKN